MLDIISFYEGKIKNKSGLSIDQILNMDDEELEKNHTYIQWLFPLQEKSREVPSSPVISDFQVNEFKNNREVRNVFIDVIEMMMEFYGLHISAFEIEKGNNWEERSKNWLTSKNHNFLRLTRIMKSLMLLGYTDCAKALYNCLCEIYEENKEIIGPITKQYWDEAVEE
jgi:hypothetical protein